MCFTTRTCTVSTAHYLKEVLYVFTVSSGKNAYNEQFHAEFNIIFRPTPERETGSQHFFKKGNTKLAISGSRHKIT